LVQIQPPQPILEIRGRATRPAFFICSWLDFLTASIMEFRNDKAIHEAQYFGDPFEAPAWRKQWVQEIA
jgi:hypothetical protein